jgi:hypothetical protein
MSTSRPRRFEKRVESRAVTYRLTRFVAGESFGIELCVPREVYEDGRVVVARRLLRARLELHRLAERYLPTEEHA